ncbi:MAG TPA: site-2 protease family protein [Candidatus Binataceae bacterium]|nr:site-2 protease family protein [Candidatus Binataceae bacterium]
MSTESTEKKEPLHEFVARVSAGSPVLSDIPRYSQPTTPTAQVLPAGIPFLNAALFILTFLTTTMAGAYMAGADLSLLRPFSSGLQLYAGLTFSIPLMAILLAHEMGHYVTSRRNRVDVSAPYFIPAPFPSYFFIGTFGAFIRMKSMPRSRRVLFDIGAAGPWAGALVTIPVLILGLALSKVGPLKQSAGGFELGNSILFHSMAKWILHVDPDTVSVDLSPIAFAGWLGLFVTALNLLPASQLDGGHVIYALFGRRHRTISRLVVLGCVLMVVIPFMLGKSYWPGWLFWAVLLFAFGLGHPVTADVDTPLDPMRRFAAWATIALFIVTFSPVPFSITAPSEPDQQQQDEKLYSVMHTMPAPAAIPLTAPPRSL